MEFPTSIQDLKINKDRSIGNVVFVVEGSVYEFNLLKKIFHDVLQYNYVKKSRNDENFENYCEFSSPKNINSKILVINSFESTINHLVDSREYLDNLFHILAEKFDVNTKNSPIYYIWDRDCKSNFNVIDLFPFFSSAYGSSSIYGNGLLLLNYPCCESYVLSNFVNDMDDKSIYDDIKKLQLRKTKQKNKLKTYNGTNGYSLKNINENTLLLACYNMLIMMKKCGIDSIEDNMFENFENVNTTIYNFEEEFYTQNEMYRFLSLLSIALLELQIIYI